LLAGHVRKPFDSGCAVRFDEVGMLPVDTPIEEFLQIYNTSAAVCKGVIGAERR
jgi:hypothetical protein